MPSRLPHWDYAAPGAYFITACTYRRRLSFGVVEDDRVSLSLLGRLVDDCLSDTFDRERGVGLEASVVMPNHVHLIVMRDVDGAATLPIDRLVTVFRARVTHAARRSGLVCHREPVWQRGYFDRVIRTQQEHAALVAYIETNPIRWTLKRTRASG